MKNLFWAIASVLVLASCSSVNSAKLGGKQASLNETQWRLADDVKGSAPTLIIAEGKASGNAGCNNYTSVAYLDTTVGNFKLGNIAATKKACPDMSVENNYLKILAEANKYVVTETTLELYKDGLLLLKFNKMP